MAGLPPNIPLGHPPPGAVTDFNDPDTLIPVFSIVCFTLLGVSAFVLALRLYTRTIILHSLGNDDFALVIALVLCALSTGSSQWQSSYGLGKHVWNVRLVDFTNYIRLFTAAGTTYLVGVMTIKISLLILYKRTFPSKNNRIFRIVWWFTLCFLVLYTIPCTVIGIVNCRPAKASWDFMLMQKAKCLDVPLMFIVHGALNSFTDLLILLIPVPLVWRLKMSVKRKILVLMLFALGSFACVISFYRFIRLAAKHGTSGVGNDFTWDSMTATIFSLVEFNCAIICACAMTLRPLFRRYSTAPFGSLPSESGLSGSRQTKSTGYSSSGNRSRNKSNGNIYVDTMPFTNNDRERQLEHGYEFKDMRTGTDELRPDVLSKSFQQRTDATGGAGSPIDPEIIHHQPDAIVVKKTLDVDYSRRVSR